MSRGGDRYPRRLCRKRFRLVKATLQCCMCESEGEEERKKKEKDRDDSPEIIVCISIFIDALPHHHHHSCCYIK